MTPCTDHAASENNTLINYRETPELTCLRSPLDLIEGVEQQTHSAHVQAVLTAQHANDRHTVRDLQRDLAAQGRRVLPRQQLTAEV